MKRLSDAVREELELRHRLAEAVHRFHVRDRLTTYPRFAPGRLSHEEELLLQRLKDADERRRRGL